MTGEQQRKLTEIVKSYIRTWENEYSKAATEHWTSVAENAENNISEAKEILALLENK